MSAAAEAAETSVREAVPEDASGIADVHVRTWQVAYRGQLPDEFLAGLTEALPRRAEWWRRQLEAAPTPRHRVWVADHSARIVGFVSIGPETDGGERVGELYAIYVDPDYWDRGIGRDLFIRATEALRAQGNSAAVLWVLESNERARRFYEAGGWRFDGGRKTDQRGDLELREVRYRVTFERARD